jgi:acyl transferase domain-containing protein
MEAVGKLWANGVEIDWKRWRKGRRRRVELPGYAFEEERYWVEGVRNQAGAGAIKRKDDVADWFYAPVWKETPVVRREEEARRWLIMEDEAGIGGQIAAELERQGGVVTRVKRAGRYERSGEREYLIRVGEAGDYRAVLKALEERGELPEKAVHLFGLSSAGDGNAPDWERRIEEAEANGFYSLVYLAQAIGQQSGVKDVELVVVSNGVADVTGEEDVRAEKALALGPIKVIGQEYPHLKSRYIDVIIPPPGSWQEERLIGQLVSDFSARSTDQVVAYRGKRRWAQTYKATRPAPAPAGAGLRPAGVYLITGGLGKIGMALAEYLAHSVKARLALIGREGLPPRSEWKRLMGKTEGDEELKRKINKIKELEEIGAEVEVFAADVSNEREMKEVVRRTRRRFGPINGVIHAAGITDQQSVRPIQEITPANSSMLFRPKLHGAFVLNRIFRRANLDFCLCLSSLSSILGGLGFAAYSGSNISMDALVSGIDRISQAPWISVNWDGWRLKLESEQPAAGLGSGKAELAIRPREGVEVFQRIISEKMTGQIIVSTGDLQSRISQWIDLESLQGEQTQSQSNPALEHSRPALQTAYVAPRSDLEKSIAAIWQNLLGIKEPGVHDNFFELGGHSLLAIQYLSRLRQTFQIEIPIQILFEKSTIAEHGEIVEEALIKEIEALTEEEVASMWGEDSIR